MKRLNFKRLWIVSDKEKSARIESLNQLETVVTSHGVNRTGKSSFIKSLYAALGADPKKNNKDWEDLEVKLLLEFSLDSITYYSLRVGRNIAIFDSSKELVAAHYGISKSAETWASLLDARIQFPGQSGGLIDPFPAAFFMPFYIDQDTGLNETWDSFDGLNAYKDSKNTLVNFHTGSLPKEYYLAKAEKDVASGELTRQQRERSHFEFVQDKLQASTLDSDLAFDPSIFEKEIEAFLARQNKFSEIKEGVRQELKELQGGRSQLLQERKLAVSTLKELEADVAYLRKIDTSEIVCPTCNTVHLTSFANTLRLSGDAQTCRDYFDTTNDALIKVSDKIEKKSKELRQYEQEIAQINAILDEKRGELTLRSMLVHESRRIAGASIDLEKEKIDILVGNINQRITEASAKMRASNDAKRRSEIMEYYQGKLREFCVYLNLTAPPERMFLELRPIIESTGSDLPRLILAYHYAVLHTIYKYSTCVMAPIVFDTAQHQDQDKTNINAMIKLAFEKRPSGIQFIFGTVELHDFEYSGVTVLSPEKAKLLSKSYYSSARDDILPFYDKLIASRT